MIPLLEATLLNVLTFHLVKELYLNCPLLHYTEVFTAQYCTIIPISRTECKLLIWSYFFLAWKVSFESEALSPVRGQANYTANEQAPTASHTLQLISHLAIILHGHWLQKSPRDREKAQTQCSWHWLIEQITHQIC